MNNQELLDLLELIHDSVECRCYGSMYYCDLLKRIRELRSQNLSNNNGSN